LAKLKYLKVQAYIYALFACFFTAAAFAPLAVYARWGLVGAAVVSVAFFVDQWRFYKHEERKVWEYRSEPTPPEVQVSNAQSVWFRELRETIRLLQELAPEELAAITVMVEETMNLAAKVTSGRAYPFNFARQRLLWDVRAGKYGFNYLPAINKYSGITRRWMEALTNDLIELGCAQRDKPNTRAYLVEDPEVCLVRLWPEIGEKE